MSTTQFAARQLQDAIITDVKIAAGAGILSSKLADGSNFLKKDGSVTLTGTLNAGSQVISNVSTPGSSGDAANKAYVDTQINNLNSIFDSKPSAKAATTGNIVLSNPATSTFDTIALSAGDILFVRAQAAGAENGLYIFNGAAVPLTRIPQMNTWTMFPGGLFTVEQGSVYISTIWFCTNAQGGTLGTTPVTFQQINAAGLIASNFVDKEAPSGAYNGSNTTYSLANTPVSGSEHVYLNGGLQESGAGNDYTVTGATITMLTAPLASDKIRISYRK